MYRTFIGGALSALALSAAAASARDITVTWIAGNAALQTEHRIRTASISMSPIPG